ncbi:MAG: hypothetical protein SO161_08565 [Treponema sp.]|nr:hypothetical protein [Treponema sp.]
MKKSAISFLLCFLFPPFFTIPSFAQSAKDKWAISGMELGSYNKTESTSINSKGEIVWTNSNLQWEDFGWDLRDTDLSQYEGIRIVLDDSLEIPINALKLDNGYSPGHWLFHETYPGEYKLYFDGRNKNSVFGYVDEMDSAYGFLIYFTVPGNKKNLITKIKSVELIKNHSSSKDKNLAPFGIQPGTTNIRAFVEDNTFIWKRGYNDSSSGWDFTGIDLSDYDRVLVEVAESDKNLNLILCDGEWKNWHCYGRIAPTVYEASLSGDGARWVDTDAHPFDLKNGLMVMLQKQDTENRLSESKTVVKTIRFLKKGEKGFADRNLEILGRGIGAIEDNTIVEENTVIWQKDNTELKCGWNLVGIDLSEYSGIRIVFEKNDLKLELTLADKEWQNWAAFRSSDPYSIEASFSGEGASWKWQDFKPYNKKDGFLIFLRFYSEKPLRKDKKTIIKRVELIKK